MANRIVSSNDVMRGYRLETVRTNEAVSYARPSNARLIGTWHLTDAYEAVARIVLMGEVEAKGGGGEWTDSSFPVSSPTEQGCLSNRSSPSTSTSTFLFPIGSHVVTSLWAHVWGRARPQLRNASNEIAAVGAPMFARRGQSFLWTAATTNGSVLVTWENFFLKNNRIIELANNRISGTTPSGPTVKSSDHSTSSPVSDSIIQLFDYSIISPISAQLELFPSGDFIARSNAVERVYRRVNPDDWDGDGIPNAEDDAPLVAADEPQFGPRQTRPAGANSNAYCWVDLVVRQANAKVTFAGDDASALADPSFIAKAGETNRVILLIGKAYRVTCPIPFALVGKSSDDIEESWEADGAALWLRWPVSISSERPTDEGTLMTAEHTFSDSNLSLASFTLLSAFQTSAKPPKLSKPSKPSKPSQPFTMHVSPAGIGGSFTWTNVCCRVSGSGYSFAVTCDSDCACGGCAATGYLEYEGYRLPAYGGFCGCGGSEDNPHEDEGPDEDPPLPGASATFSKSVVFFEDEYENAPGETVSWQSTETTLSCWAYGGTRGGHVRIEIEGADGLVQYGGLPLPFEQDLAPDEDVEFENVYRAVSPSGGEGDVVVTTTFTENETDWTETTIDRATAVKIELETVALMPGNRMRHIYGVGERVYCRNTPDVSCEWSVSSPAELGKAFGVFVLRCPLVMASLDLTVSLDGCSYTPVTGLVEPSAIVCSKAEALDFGLPTGHAGGVGLRLDLYVLPDSVSFSGLAMQEIPSSGTHDGYFNSPVFTNIWNHTKDRKAGIWKAVSPDNFYMTDEACLGDEMPQLCPDGTIDDSETFGWSDGRIVWPIPMGWQSRDACDTDLPALKRMGRSYAQVFKIDSDGTASVGKHGFEAIRGTNTIIRLLKRNGE